MQPPLQYSDLADAKAGFTALDFAIITLLQIVKCEVVEPKIKRWQDNLDQPSQETTHHNLAAGFLTIWPQAEAHVHLLGEDPLTQTLQQKLSDFVWGKDTLLPKAELKRLLKDCGHILFNSYYYTLIQEFGERGLVPAIPGSTYPVDRDAYRKLQDFIQRSCLPLHVTGHYTDNYSTLLLPLRAGITPRLLQLYFAGIQDTPTWRIGNFLGDLAILHKREDFVHRHFCALIAAMGNPSDASGSPRDVSPGPSQQFGAYVLTSVIPNSFDKDDETTLAKVMLDWTHAPVQAIHSGLRRTIRGIHTQLQWTGRGATGKSEASGGQIRETLREALENLSHDGAYLLRGQAYDSGHEVARMSAVNIEGLQRLLANQFPDGPWLDPAVVSKGEQSSNSIQPVIDINRLRSLCEALENLTSLSTGSADRQRSLNQLLENTGFASFVSAVWPDYSRESVIQCDELDSALFIEPIFDSGGLLKGRLILFRGLTPGHSDDKQVPNIAGSTREAIATISKSLQLGLDSHVLPGATNPFFTKISRIWNEDYAFANRISDTQVSERESSEARIAHAIRQLMSADPSIRGLALLTMHQIYIPDLITPSEETRVQASETLLSYPSFWLLESLCHYFAEGIRVDQFAQSDRRVDMWAPPFRSSDAQIKLIPSVDQNANAAFASALTYLGIPIVGWLPPAEASQSNAWSINSGTLSDDISAIYAKHLRSRLEAGANEPSLARAWAGSAFGKKIAGIEVTISTRENVSSQTPTRIISFVIALKGSPPLTLRWVAQSSFAVAFAAFSESALLASHLACPCERPHAKEIALVLSTLTAKGGEKRWTTGESGTDAKFNELHEVLREEIVKRRTIYQAGVTGQQLQLAHEIRRGFPALAALLRYPSIKNTTDAGLKSKISEFNSALSLLQLRTSSFSEFASKDYLFRDETASEMARRLIELGIADGVQGQFDFDTVAPAMESLIKRAAEPRTKICLDDVAFQPDTPETLRMRLAVENIILVVVANAAKHLSKYVYERLCARDSTQIEKMEKSAFFRIKIGPDSVSTENLGRMMSGEEFKAAFCAGTGKTYSVLQTLVAESIWQEPGSISVDARPPLDPIQDEDGRDIPRISVYYVSVKFPKGAFVEAYK